MYLLDFFMIDKETGKPVMLIQDSDQKMAEVYEEYKDDPNMTAEEKEKMFADYKSMYDSFDKLAGWHNELACDFFDLYQSGKLAETGKVESHVNYKGNTCVDFCIDIDKLPANLADKIRVHLGDPCLYSGCYPAIHFGMRCYRSYCYTVGSSFETAVVQELHSPDADIVADVLHETGDPYQAGCKALERLWADDRATDDYENECAYQEQILGEDEYAWGESGDAF